MISVGRWEYADCCPPVTDPKNHNVDSISGMFQKGAGLRKLSKRVRKGLKMKVVRPTRKMTKKVSKTIVGKVRKLSKRLRRKKSKSRKNNLSIKTTRTSFLSTLIHQKTLELGNKTDYINAITKCKHPGPERPCGASHQ